MVDEDKEDFNAMLHDSKDMSKMKIIIDTGSIKKYGDSRTHFTSSIDYDTFMRRVSSGKVTTVGELRDHFTRVSHADFMELITADIFASIAVWVSAQRRDDSTPYWRTLKASGELNAKYPGGVSAQKEKLEVEDHTVIYRGRKNIRYFVKDYESALSDLTQGEQAS